MSDIYFFTDVDLLNDQTADQAFGVKSETKFHLTSSFIIDKDKNACAYAIMSGSALFLEQVNDNNKVNVILKPLISPRIKMPVKYIVYRGLKKTDDIVCAKVNETDIVDKYFYPCNYNTENGMLAVDAGCVLGTFEKNSECGLEIILENSDLEFTIEKALLPNWSLEVPNEDTLQNRWKREQIRHFVDPAAFYGLHCEIQGGIYYNSKEDTTTNNKLSHTNNAAEVYGSVLSKFQTKNTVYLDIRNEDGYSYDYYKDKTSDIRIPVYRDLQNKICCYDRMWPLFKVDNQYINYENSSNTSYENFRAFVFVDFPVTSNDSYAIIRYVKGIVVAKEEPENVLKFETDLFQKGKDKYFRINKKQGNESYPTLFNGVSIPYCQGETCICYLSTIIRVDYIREPVSGIEKLFPVNINIPYEKKSQTICWNCADVEKLYETETEKVLMHIGMAEENNMCTYFSIPKTYLCSPQNKQYILNINNTGCIYKYIANENFLSYLDRRTDIIFTNTTVETNNSCITTEGESDVFIIGITNSEKKSLLEHVPQYDNLYFNIVGYAKNVYRLFVCGENYDGLANEKFLNVYSVDKKIFASKNYLENVSIKNSKITVEFQRDPKYKEYRFHYGFDWYRDEKYCTGTSINNKFDDKNYAIECLGKEYLPDNISGHTYYAPWLCLYENHEQIGKVLLRVSITYPYKLRNEKIQFIPPEGIKINLNSKNTDDNDTLISSVKDLKNKPIEVVCTQSSDDDRILTVINSKKEVVGKLNIFRNSICVDLPDVRIIKILFRGSFIENAQMFSLTNDASDQKDTFYNLSNNFSNWESRVIRNQQCQEHTKLYLHQCLVNYKSSLNSPVETVIVDLNAEKLIHNNVQKENVALFNKIKNDGKFELIKKDNIAPSSDTKQTTEEYDYIKVKHQHIIDIIETFFDNSYLNIAYLPYKMIEKQGEVAWATYDKNIVCLCGDPTSFKNYMLAHEILHTLGLRHSFFEQEVESNIYKKIMYEQGKTENLMDYKGDKYSTFKWQWEQIYENYKNK